MPALVFPAPGFTTSTQFLSPFSGFDIAPSSGGTLRNLFLFSQNLSKPVWINSTKYQTVSWYSYDQDIITADNRIDVGLDVESTGTQVVLFSNVATVGQLVTVTSDTVYTMSFYAKAGTADVGYAITDASGNFIVSTSSYVSSLTTSSWTRVQSTFTATSNSIIAYPVRAITTGTIRIFGAQLEQGTNATNYQSTNDISYAALNVVPTQITYNFVNKLSAVNRLQQVTDQRRTVSKTSAVNRLQQVTDQRRTVSKTSAVNRLQQVTDQRIKSEKVITRYKLTQTVDNRSSTRLELYQDITFDSDWKYNITGISPRIFYQTVSWYINDSDIITYSTSTATTTVIAFPQQTFIPFLTGTQVKIKNSASGYDKTVSVLYGTSSAITVDYDSTLTGIKDYTTIENLTATVYPKPFDFRKFPSGIPSKSGTQVTTFEKPLISAPDNRRTVDKVSAANKLRQVDDNHRYVNTLTSYTTTTFDFRKFPSGIPSKSGTQVTTFEKPLISAPDNRGYVNTLTSYTLTTKDFGRFPSGIAGLAGIQVSTLGPSGKEISGAPDPVTAYQLTPFTTLTTGTVFGLSGQDNIVYNVLNYITYDEDILTKFVGDYVYTIYFVRESTLDGVQTIPFPTGSYVKVTNATKGYDQTFQVQAATPNSITLSFDGVETENIVAAGFPNTANDDTRIQSLNTFVYPKERVFNDLISVQLPYEPINSRENFFFSTYVPNTRGLKYFIDRDVGDAGYITTAASTSTARLELYQDIKLDGDWKYNITGISPRIFYQTVSWYVNDSDIITYSTSTATTTVITFPQQTFIPFPTGAQVRIKNSAIGYDKTVSVLYGTPSTITVDYDSTLPETKEYTTIENLTASVYSQSRVVTTSAPTNARENLYYFYLAPGYRNNTLVTPMFAIGSTQNNISVGTVSRGLKVQSVPDNRPVYRAVSIARPQEIIDSRMYSTPTGLEYFQDTKLDADWKYNITGISPRIFYQSVSWYINDSDIITYTTSTSSTSSITFPQQTFIPFPTGSQIRIKNSATGYDKTVSVLYGTSSAITVDYDSTLTGIKEYTTIENLTASVYSQSRVVTTSAPTNARENLYYFYLAPGYRNSRTISYGAQFIGTTKTDAPAKLSAAAKLKGENATRESGVLRKQLMYLQGDNNLRFSASKLLNIARLRSDRNLIFDVDALQPFKLRVDQTQVFYITNATYGREQRYVIPPFGQINLSKLAAAQVLRADKNILRGSEKITSNAVLRNDNNLVFDVDALQPFKLRSNQTQVFYVPSTDNLTSIQVLRSDRSILRGTEMLQRQLMLLKSDSNDLTLLDGNLSKEGTYKFSPAYDRTFTADALQPFKLRSNQTQVFYVPLTDKLGSAQVLRSDRSILLSTEKLKFVTDLRSDRTRLSSTEMLQRQLMLIKSDNINLNLLDGNLSRQSILVRADNNLAFDVDALQPFKLRVDQTQVFYVPSTDRLTAMQVLRADKSILLSTEKLKFVTDLRSDRTRLSSTEMLQRQLMMIRNDNNNLNLLNGMLQRDSIKLRTDRNLTFDVDALQPFKLRVDQTQVFYTPESTYGKEQRYIVPPFARLTLDKLTSAQVLRADKSILLSTEKLKYITDLRIDRNLTFDVDLIENPFKLRSNQTQVFYVPSTTAKLISAQPLRADASTLRSIEKLNYISSLRDDRNNLNLLDGTLQKQLQNLRADNNLTFDVDLIENPFKLRSNQTQVFYVPSTDKLSVAQVLRADNRSSIIVDKLSVVSRLKTDNNLTFDVDLIQNPFKLRSNQTQVFYVPSTDKLSAAQVLRSDRNTIFTAEKLTSTQVLRGDILDLTLLDGNLQQQLQNLRADNNLAFDVDLLSLFKVDRTQVFYTPSVDKVSQGFVVRDTSKINLSVDKLGVTSVIRGDNNLTFDVEALTQFKVDRTQVFYTPSTDKLTAIQVLRSDRIILSSTEMLQRQLMLIKSDSNNLNLLDGNLSRQSIFLRPVTSILNTDTFKRGGFLVRADPIDLLKTISYFTRVRSGSGNFFSIFMKPYVERLNGGLVVKSAERTRLTVSQVNAVIKPRDVSRYRATDQFIDNYQSQLNYSNITAPDSPRARYQYFLMAPGFRYNHGIQQGRVYEPSRATVRADQLAVYNNTDFTDGPRSTLITTSDPVIRITGRTSQFTNNTVLWYRDDLEILTLLPIGSPTLTLYFSPTEAYLPLPFPAGCTVRITRSNSSGLFAYYKEVTVLSSDAVSITVTDIPDLPSTSELDISRVGTGYDVYAYFTPIFDAANTGYNRMPYAMGDYVKLTNNANATDITLLPTETGYNYVKFTKIVDGFYLPVVGNGTIENASITLWPQARVKTKLNPISGREIQYYLNLVSAGYRKGVRITTVSSEISGGASSLPSYDALEKKVGTLIAIKYSPTDGRIYKYQTGDFKKGSTGISDVAVQKKEPIQFWN